MWEQVITYIAENRLDSASSVVGLGLTALGFSFTIWKVLAAKSAAVLAHQAATDAQQAISKYDTVAAFSSVLTMLDEIKRHHRNAVWAVLPDRYSEPRRKLIEIRSVFPSLDADRQKSLQGVISHLSGMETEVEKHLVRGAEAPDAAKFNRMISKDADELADVFISMRQDLGAG